MTITGMFIPRQKILERTLTFGLGEHVQYFLLEINNTNCAVETKQNKNKKNLLKVQITQVKNKNHLSTFCLIHPIYHTFSF